MDVMLKRRFFLKKLMNQSVRMAFNATRNKRTCSTDHAHDKPGHLAPLTGTVVHEGIEKVFENSKPPSISDFLHLLIRRKGRPSKHEQTNHQSRLLKLINKKAMNLLETSPKFQRSKHWRMRYSKNAIASK